MEYWRDGKTYKGFTSALNKQSLTSGNTLAIVWFEGDPELWYYEGEEGLKTLRAMYEEEWGADRIRIDTWTIRTSQR